MADVFKEGDPILSIRRRVLIADDQSINREILGNILNDDYDVLFAEDGAQALKVMRDCGSELSAVLLDLSMPVMDGYETCHYLKHDEVLKDIPVIFLTARDGVKVEEKGFALGAVDYILKPISPPLLLARIKTHLTLKLARDFLRDKNVYLEAEVARRVSEVSRLQEVSIAAMASLAETRDNETGMH